MGAASEFVSAAYRRASGWLRPRTATAGRPQGEATDFQSLTEHSSDVICRASPDGTLIYVSPSSIRVLGWTPEEMVGRHARDLTLPEDLPILGSAIAQLMAREVEQITTISRSLRKDAPPLWVETSARMVWNEATNTPRFTVLVLRDISEHKQLEDQLAALALKDGLTGLPNRRAFDEGLAREWGRTLREGTQMSLLLLDVDRFKAFNDHYGHQVGDDCLRMVAAAIDGAIRRPMDMAARYGGEEIAVILPGTDATGAIAVAEQVRMAVAGLQLPHDGNPEGGGHVTVSIGAATALSRAGGTMSMAATLLSAADVALYKAKNAGRNRVETALVLAPLDETSDIAS